MISCRRATDTAFSIPIPFRFSSLRLNNRQCVRTRFRVPFNPIVVPPSHHMLSSLLELWGSNQLLKIRGGTLGNSLVAENTARLQDITYRYFCSPSQVVSKAGVSKTKAKHLTGLWTMKIQRLKLSNVIPRDYNKNHTGQRQFVHKLSVHLWNANKSFYS